MKPKMEGFGNTVQSPVDKELNHNDVKDLNSAGLFALDVLNVAASKLKSEASNAGDALSNLWQSKGMESAIDSVTGTFKDSLGITSVKDKWADLMAPKSSTPKMPNFPPSIQSDGTSFHRAPAPPAPLAPTRPTPRINPNMGNTNFNYQDVLAGSQPKVPSPK